MYSSGESMHTYTHTYTHTCMNAHACAHTHSHTHIYIYIFGLFIVENTTIIAHEINELRQQILEILHIKRFEKKITLMMAYGRSESAWDNFSKFIYQLQPKARTLVRKLERIVINYIDKMAFLLFNQTCLNEVLQPNSTYTHMSVEVNCSVCACVCVCVYECMCVCVCVWVCVFRYDIASLAWIPPCWYVLQYSDCIPCMKKGKAPPKKKKKKKKKESDRLFGVWH